MECKRILLIHDLVPPEVRTDDLGRSASTITMPSDVPVTFMWDKGGANGRQGTEIC